MGIFQVQVGYDTHRFLIVADDAAVATKLAWSVPKICHLHDLLKGAERPDRLTVTQLPEIVPGVVEIS